MYKIGICLSLFLFLAVLSCTKTPEELNLEPEAEALVSILQDEMKPQDTDPLNWDDQDLRWLDPLASKSIIGLGESLYIDEVVQQGNTAEVENIMNSRMHFWTWKTEEVKDLLEWMCSYNQGKVEEERVHYMGVDCQFNTYHPTMAREYLSTTGIPFQSFVDSILQVAETESANNFESYNSASFAVYLGKLEALQDSMILYKDLLVGASSEKEYQLHSRIVKLVRQVSEVKYYMQIQRSSGMDYRDKYMAENASWLQDYFENEKIVVWAHNYHISNLETGVIGTMGSYLNYELGDQYATLGFLFSQGTFTAVTMEGENFKGLDTQTINTEPRENSLNALMSYTNVPAFSVEIEALHNYLAWYNAFEKGVEFFWMGSAYNNNPEDYYTTFDPLWFDYMIYFDRSTASDLL